MASNGHVQSTNSADHIRQLSEIDQDVTKLLQSAGLAIKALTHSRQMSTAGDGRSLDAFAERREAFSEAASQYFDTLASIDVHLRQQINDLEETNILPVESTIKDEQPVSVDAPTGMVSTTNTNVNISRPSGVRKGAITGGGLGSLDVGWLNSRNDNVGKEMEAELWEEAQELLEKVAWKGIAGFDAQAATTDKPPNSNDQNKYDSRMMEQG